MTCADIQAELEKLGSQDVAKILQRFFKTGPGQYGEGDRFRGIKVPVLRKLVKKNRDLSTVETEKLLSSVWHEDRMLALLLLIDAYRRGDPAVRQHIYNLYLRNTRFINNWDLVDVTAQHIVGAYLNLRSKEPLYRLARSEMLWERRIAILATFHYIRQGLFDETLRLAEMLLRDEHELIHKAVGWLLREVGKRSRSAEERFLQANYKEMPRTMLRYAIERFPEALRKKYLQGKI